LDKERFTGLSVDDLWRLYEDVTEVLEGKILAEKQELEAKLDRLQQASLRKTGAPSRPRQKRKYPKVLPKFQNPKDPSQTWSGRGKQPLWVAALLRSGVRLESLLLPQYRNWRRK
jgi:DNA-binding protein H-NS